MTMAMMILMRLNFTVVDERVFQPQKRVKRAAEEGSGTSDTDEGLKVSKCSLKG